MYILLGTALDGISMIVLTTAVVLPMIQQAGFDLIWFGMFVILIVEMAEITPPVGFNLFVLQAMSGKDSNTVAWAALPFFLLLVLAAVIITIFPGIVMFLLAPCVSDRLNNGRSQMFKSKRYALLGARRRASFTASSAVAQTKWNLPSAYPATNFHTENLAQFAKDVEAGSKGKLTITLHPGATLFKAPEIKRAVQTGQAEIGEVLVSLLENEDPVFGVDVVPFLATSYAQARRLYDASKPAMEKKFASQGIVLLYAVPWPPQGIYAKKDINSVNDLKGLKWRAYNAGTTRIAELAGAQAVTVQQAELAQALATGVVDLS